MQHLFEKSKAWRSVEGVLSGAGHRKSKRYPGDSVTLRFLPDENNYSHEMRY